MVWRMSMKRNRNRLENRLEVGGLPIWKDELPFVSVLVVMRELDSENTTPDLVSDFRKKSWSRMVYRCNCELASLSVDGVERANIRQIDIQNNKIVVETDSKGGSLVPTCHLKDQAILTFLSLSQH